MRYVALRIELAHRYRSDPLDALLTSLDGSSRRVPATREDVAEAIRLGERVARHWPVGSDTCLFRALARYALLHEAGHAPRFVMGIDEDDVAKGHAWVELAGVPFLEPRSPRFRRTLEHPPRA
ncbi:lasso peptide biosynthesis B2 protein [Sandaracinus amylolyticus]|uniref:Microcin J25-processing protein McjB C-terminal domain-containing protein n=1 Tax=Sandaracinus amylolyticus TaxID=927083 RepID=A0A0F6W469_9BACT|nr:lasso peptide biosynthesis B2 protein [Sandaracinus amylolyticus]AKF06973.1 hypothetical protein DB32_004122 [Sandaracinus amylolyticus]